MRRLGKIPQPSLARPKKCHIQYVACARVWPDGDQVIHCHSGLVLFSFVFAGHACHFMSGAIIITARLMRDKLEAPLGLGTVTSLVLV